MENSPFETIESAQEFLQLLTEEVDSSRKEIEADLAETGENGNTRHRDALLLVAHQLNMLSTHLSNSRRILNDLRSLRRLLLEERTLAAKTSPSRF